MCDAVCVRVPRPKSFGQTRTGEINWLIAGPTIETIQERCGDKRTPKIIAITVANSLPLGNLRQKVLAEEAKPKAYKKPVVVEEEIVLSLQGRQREHIPVELRAISAGVIEIWPRRMPASRHAHA